MQFVRGKIFSFYIIVYFLSRRFVKIVFKVERPCHYFIQEASPYLFAVLELEKNRIVRFDQLRAMLGHALTGSTRPLPAALRNAVISTGFFFLVFCAKRKKIAVDFPNDNIHRMFI